MLELDRSVLRIFRTKDVYFSDRPFDISGYHVARFFGCKQRSTGSGFVERLSANIIINLEQNLDDIWKGMDKSSTRYSIRRAMRDGAKVRQTTDYDKFLEIDRAFRATKGLPPSYVDALVLSRHGVLFEVLYDSQVVAGHFFLVDVDRASYYMGASVRLRADKHLAGLVGNGSKLAIWEAIKFAKARGLKYFDLGGYTLSPRADAFSGINSFKRSFGGKLVCQYDYVKFYSALFRCILGIGDATLRSFPILTIVVGR